jgi:outer membrane protein assembly factor BamB
MFGLEGREYAAAFDVANGQQIWRFEMGGNFRNAQGDGPRATPIVAGGLVYALGARSKLYALDVASGEERWGIDLAKDLGAKVPEWGTSASPLVEGPYLIVDVAGRKDFGVVAFDKTTGEIAWHAGSHRAAYSSPIAVTIGGERQLVLFTAAGLQGVAAQNGQRLWSSPWTTDWDVNAATPVFVPRNGIFISSGYDTGATLLQILEQEDEFKVHVVWRNRLMKNHFNSSVFVGSSLYGFDMGTLKCLDALTGEEKWRARGGFSKGSLLYADGHLIVMGGSGNLALVEATPEGFRSKSRVRILEGKTWTMPSLANGILTVRDFNEMVALRMTASAD